MKLGILLFLSSSSFPTHSQDHPNVGPVRGVSYHDWRRVKRFRDETCTLRLCEGADLFAQIQQDLSPWRKRGGISARDVDSAMMAGIKGCK